MLHPMVNRAFVACTCALALLLTGCGGGGSAAPATESALFVPASHSNTVGAAGGSVRLTAPDGTQYTLEVPAGALPGTTTLSLTTAAPGEGQRFRVVAGPDGLLFKSGTAATLTIRLPAGRELPDTAGLIYSGTPVASTRNADGSVSMKLHQLRGSASPTTAMAHLQKKLAQVGTRVMATVVVPSA